MNIKINLSKGILGFLGIAIPIIIGVSIIITALYLALLPGFTNRAPILYFQSPFGDDLDVTTSPNPKAFISAEVIGANKDSIQIKLDASISEQGNTPAATIILPTREKFRMLEKVWIVKVKKLGKDDTYHLEWLVYKQKQYDQLISNKNLGFHNWNPNFIIQ